MPERFGIRRGEVPPPVVQRYSTTWIEKVLGVAVTLLLVLVLALLVRQSGQRDDLRTNRRLLCDIAVKVDIDTGSHCGTDE